jgi:hypothetical protein
MELLRADFERGLRVLEATRSGGRAKAAAKRSAVAVKHAQWRQRAAEIWSRHPTLTATAVAGRIDSSATGYIRQLIADLKPSKNT